MKLVESVAFEQIVIVSLMKNLLWNGHHGSIVILFCKNVFANQMSFLFIEFNFCPKNKESQIVKITLLAFTSKYEDQNKSILSFLKKIKQVYSILRLIYIVSVDTVQPLAQKRTEINT